MKILLVGEYSRLHNSLKEGLQKLGHEVTIISTGDHFKQFPSDILLKRKYDNGILKKLKVGLYKLFKIDITSISLRNQFFKYKESLQGFDIVQLINESAFSIEPKYEIEIIEFLKKNNNKLFLLSCGADHTSIKFAVDKKIRYSIMTPYLEGIVPAKDYGHPLKFLKPEFENLHQFIVQSVDGILASDMDYDIPLQGHKKYLGLMPNPVNTSKLDYIPISIDGKIKVFHGINRTNYFKKGNDYFEAVLERVQKTYASKVEVITVENIPYSEYIKKYNAAHILLDQVFSFDQGYNALEAMAKGKVVFTGAETEFLETYNLNPDEVCINALADVDYLFQKLEELILNPEKLTYISKNARAFIEREHDYILVANKYLEAWKSSNTQEINKVAR